MIRLGTRGSALAMTQSRTVADAIERITGRPVELVTIVSQGDRSSAPLESLGGTGVFATALREALLADRCDVVVHSSKDLPTAPYPGLRIGAYPPREDARDALCTAGAGLRTLPAGARVGTSSPRRRAQLRRARPDLDVRDLRGNVDTRLRRVHDGDLDAVVLAAAGLARLGRAAEATELLELDAWPTAPGQGALAVEMRAESAGAVDDELAGALARIDVPAVRLAVETERAVLARLEAGCAAPIGVTATLDAASGLACVATVYAPDGSDALTAFGTATADPEGSLRLADRLGADLLDRGAAALAPLGAAR